MLSIHLPKPGLPPMRKKMTSETARTSILVLALACLLGAAQAFAAEPAPGEDRLSLEAKVSPEIVGRGAEAIVDAQHDHNVIWRLAFAAFLKVAGHIQPWFGTLV